MKKTILGNSKNLIFAAIFGFVAINLWQIAAHVVSTIVYVNLTGSKELAKSAVQNNEWLTNIFYVVMELVLLWVIHYFVKREDNHQSLLHAVGMSKQGKRASSFVKGAAMAMAINIPFWIIASIFHWVNIKSSGFKDYSSISILGYTIIMGIVTLFPGFCEEIFFRGYLQNRLFQLKGKWFSLVIPSLLFIVFHIGRYHELYTAIYLFVISMVIGYLYYRTNSLFISIGFHYCWDFIASLFAEGHTPSLFMIKIFNETAVTILYTVLLIITFFMILYKKRRDSLMKINQNNAY